MYKLNLNGPIAIDTETTGILPWASPGCKSGDRPFMISLCDIDLHTEIIEWPVDPKTRQVKALYSDIEYLQWLLSRRTHKFKFFNAKFDLRMLWCMPLLQNTINELVKDIFFDEVFFKAKICNAQEPLGGYGLKPLSEKYLGIPQDDEKALSDATKKARAFGRRKANNWFSYKYGREPSKADMWMVRLWAEMTEQPEEIAKLCETYARQDAVRTLCLDYFYQGIIENGYPDGENDPSLKETYQREMRLWPAIWEMEERGMSISFSRNHRERQKADKLSQKLKKQLQEEASKKGYKNFNPGSGDQLAEILFSPEPKGFGLEPTEYTKGGPRKAPRPATGLDALRPLSSHPFVNAVQQYNSAESYMSKFADKYSLLMVPQEGDIHTLHATINQIGPITGRTSVQDPPLQQAATAEKTAKNPNPIQARYPFKARNGWILYGADYANQELRIFAELAQIKSLLDAFYEGRDANDENANRIWGGKNNPAAITAMANALELGSSNVASQLVLDAWKDLGWNYKLAQSGVGSTQAIVIAERFLSDHNYEIVAAEKSLGKKASRTRGKMVLFGIIYGGGPKAVMNLLYVTHSEAKAYISEVKRTYPEIDIYSRILMRQAVQDGYIRTVFGRRIDIDPEYSYRCVDYIVQGSAADMLKRSMIGIRRIFSREEFRGHAYQLMPMHDEVVFEIERGHDTVPLLRGVKSIMEDMDGKLQVPMVVEFATYPNSWAKEEKFKL